MKSTGMAHRSFELVSIRAQAAALLTHDAALSAKDVFTEILQFFAEFDKFCKS